MESEIDPKLRQFMQAGLPTIVADFGSMSGLSQTCDIATILTAACDLSSTRAVIQGGNPALLTSDRFLSVGYVPHEWLFERAACVILHGGAGTTASVFRAGVPGIFVVTLGSAAKRLNESATSEYK